MKIDWKSFACGILAGSVLFAGIASAAPAIVNMIVNGKEVHSEIPAQIIDGSTMVPARGLAEALGAKVTWDEARQTVVIESLERPAALSEDEAAKRAVAAREHYLHLSAGGSAEGNIQSFGVYGRTFDYRWLGADLDSKAKLTAYLEEVFTPEQVAQYWQDTIADGSIVDINGRLAQVNADGGSMWDWNQAKVRLLQDGGNQKTFLFTVPHGGINDQMEREVKLRFVKGMGWRLDEPVAFIR